jgi:hypothetical protein
MVKWLVRTAMFGSVFLMLAGTTVLAGNGCPPAGTSFFVPATAGGSEEMGGTDWFDTGIWLNGESVAISADGKWSDGCDHRWDCGTGPDGTGVQRYKGCRFIAPQLSAGGLIARVGDGDFVFVGSGPVTLTGWGPVKFAINDCYFGDNTGGFNVTMAPAW